MSESKPAPQLRDLPSTINHVSYVTDDMEKSLATFTALGATDPVEFETSVASIAMLKIPVGDHHLRVEIVMPKGKGNLFSDHMERRGPGLHHLGLSVPKFSDYFDALIAAGCIMKLDMRKAAIGSSGNAARNQGFESCYLDCSPIGGPNLELFGT